jgi:hypothetical protein
LNGKLFSAHLGECACVGGWRELPPPTLSA